jgi:hypothetical protein
MLLYCSACPYVEILVVGWIPRFAAFAWERWTFAEAR